MTAFDTPQCDDGRLFTPPEDDYTGRLLKECRTCQRMLPYDRFDMNSMSKHGKARCRDCLRSHDRLVRSSPYHELLQRFGECCNICHAEQCEPLRPDIKFCIDVDHRRMKVRGLLCKRCNVAIGMMRDDPAIIAKVIVYLLERS